MWWRRHRRHRRHRRRLCLLFLHRHRFRLWHRISRVIIAIFLQQEIIM